MINTNSEPDDVRLKAIQQAEGIEVTKTKGTKFGRPLKTLPEEWDELYLQWKTGQIKTVGFMDLVGIKKSTLSTIILL